MDTVTDSTTAFGQAIDELPEGYVSWREECQAVALSYGRSIPSGCSERQLVYAAYLAALDREEHTR
jgi:hypothetical protein